MKVIHPLYNTLLEKKKRDMRKLRSLEIRRTMQTNIWLVQPGEDAAEALRSSEQWFDFISFSTQNLVMLLVLGQIR